MELLRAAAKQQRSCVPRLRGIWLQAANSHHREAFQTCVHQVSFSTFLHLVRPSEAVSWQGTREERGLSSACTDRSLLPLHHPCKHAKLTYAVSDQNAICRILSSLLTLIPSLFKL